MDRYLFNTISDDIQRKMVFLTGPRQVGKTYLSRQLMSRFKSPLYLNYDDIAHAAIIRDRSWPLTSDLVIFDEIHKMKGWKQYLKGVYDTRKDHESMLVTGSARLDMFRQSGDSLAGRYFHFRLNPISVKEIVTALSPSMAPYDAVEALNRLGGFPEPFLSSSETEATRWRKQYFTDIVREDILEFSRLHEVKAMRMLVDMLRSRVGSPISYTALAEDLQIAPNTVRKYVDILEQLHIIFLVRPFHTNIARAVLREPKVYFYDSGYVLGDDGVRYENTVALCLLKDVQYQEDTLGAEIELHYLRTRDGREVDFAISEKLQLKKIIEVKYSDAAPSSNLSFFLAMAPVEAIQIVHNLRTPYQKNNISIVSDEWLSTLTV